jgi:two-component sensor histidine kinase
MAIAVDGTHLARTLGADERLAAVIEVIERLSLARAVPDIMDIVKRAVRRLTGADGVTFVLRDGDSCHYADEDAISPLWKGQRFPLQSCISGWAMLNGQTAVIPDIYRDPRIPHDAYRPTFVQSLVMTPVRPEDSLAAIGAYWATLHTATEDEVAVLQAIARSTAVALTNAQLYDSLRRAADEAAVLLQEVHHRVKNNLQMLADLLYLQSERAGHPDTQEALRDGSARVLDMARLQEELYRALDEGRVRLRDYLQGVVGGYVGMRDGVAVRLEADANGATLDLDRAIHCGVLVTELLGNALKHAFRSGGGEVVVRLHARQEGVQLEVQDSGPGWPADLASAEEKTMGLRLVRLSAQRLQAHLQLANAPGAACRVTFPLHAPAPVEPQRG